MDGLADGRDIVETLRRRVRAALIECGLDGGTLLVALSGGPDSLALLHALRELSEERGLTLCGAHLNHCLRGQESDADAAFAADAFKRLGMPFTVGDADVAAYRKRRKLSLEDAARQVRYRFLADAAIKHDADAIALGHTADDQVESVLMHIVRGSGLDGLRGMQTLDKRSIGGASAALFRPLLDVSRAETQAYCRALGLQPRIDASNSSPEFLRNRVRMDLVPLLERFNPSVRDALARLSLNARRDSDYIKAQVNELWDEVALEAKDGAVRLDAAALGRQHPAVQSRILMRALEALGGEGTQRHILDMMRLMGSAPGKTLNLPGGLIFVTGYGEAHIGMTAALADALRPLPALQGEHRLVVPGETRVDGWRISASVCEAGGDVRQDSDVRQDRNICLQECPSPSLSPDGGRIRAAESLDLDCVGDELRIRGRLPGDRFQPLGMAQLKSLREFMVDTRIPRHWRAGTPLVVSERGIAWVAGWRIAHWARVTQTTRRTLRLRLAYAE